ncbi:MAG: MerC domain-containing protein [Chitinophagales bacterium]
MEKGNRKNILDILGISTSVICAVHCILPPVMLSYTALGTFPFIDNIGFEILILASAAIFAAWSLIPSVKLHHQKGPLLLAFFGFSLIALAHLSHGNLIEIFMLLLGGIMLSGAHLWNWKLKNSFQACSVSSAS